MQNLTEKATSEDFDFILPASGFRDIDGEKLKAARIKVCPKQAAFAVACGWSPQYQGQLEKNGTKKLSADAINKIKNALHHFSGTN